MMITSTPGQAAPAGKSLVNPSHLQEVDDSTIMWTFPEAFPVQKLFKMDFLDFNICAEHVYAPMHPAINVESDYNTFETFQVHDDLPVPTMGPWVAVNLPDRRFHGSPPEPLLLEG